MDTIKNKPLNELVGGDISAGGNDRNVTNNSEIETGPVQKPFNDTSDYETGVSTTTDKVARRYRQSIPWFAVYSYGGASRGLRNNLNEKNNIISKQTVEETIDDLVKKRENDGLTDKNHNSKLSKLIDSIDDCDFDENQLEKLKTAILNKISNAK